VETDFVTWLLDRIPADPRLEVPPGDDAAVLRPRQLSKSWRNPQADPVRLV